MHWNEKIDLIKKKYSKDEFSVPHVKRKEILRKIESKFIKRTQSYYDLNNYNERFANWWEYLNSSKEIITKDKLAFILKKFIDTNQQCWVACDFSNQILIYKSMLVPAIDLISLGCSLTDTFHIIELKYEFLLGLKIEEDKIIVKYVEYQKSTE